VQRDGGLDALGERELAAVQAVGEKLGGVPLGDGSSASSTSS